jgi:prepilin-type N-terminal cleavage/methylation domain-containing protein
MKFFKYGQKGFTLIELLVVIAILGTLAGVVVMNVIQFIGKGACEAAKTEYHNMQTACVAAGYKLGTNSGVTLTLCEEYLLTSAKYTWTVSTGGVVAWPGLTRSPNTWPADCVQ